MIFSENMEIIIAVPEEYWDREHNSDEPTEGYIHSVKQVISDLGIRVEDISHESCGIGRGAEGTALILILVGLFFLGKRIEENMEAWIKIGRQIGRVLQKISAKGQVYLSQPVAALVAIWHISRKTKDISLLELINADVIPVDPSGFVGDNWKFFRTNPERYYIFTFKVDGKEIHTVCLRSTGRVQFYKSFSVDNWIEFYE